MDFFSRLAEYYESVGKVLAGEATAAKVFPNAADIGGTREEVYVRFLQQHVPNWCEVERGGFLFSESGLESGQIDIIVSAGSAAKYAFLGGGGGKVFRQVDGVIAAISVKSRLRVQDVQSILQDFSKIPQMSTNSDQVNPSIKNRDLTNFLLCVVYASAADDILQIAGKIRKYYSDHPGIPHNRRPSIIHINGVGVIFRAEAGAAHGDISLVENEFYVIKTEANVFGLSQVAVDIRQRVLMIPHISFKGIPDIPGILLERTKVPYQVYGPQA